MLLSSPSPSMYNICAHLGQILLIPGHYVALSSAKILSIGGLDLYPYQIAQLGKKNTLPLPSNSIISHLAAPCSIYCITLSFSIYECSSCTWSFHLDFFGNK